MPETNQGVAEATQPTSQVETAIEDLEQVQEGEVHETESAEETQGETQEPPAQGGDDGQAVTQSRRTNAEFAQRRRNAEAAQRAAQERLRQEAFNQGKIAGIGGINPYTKEPIEDEEDLHVYDLMKQLDSEGKDPIAEFPKALRKERMARKAETAAEEAETKKRQESERQAVEAVKAGIAALAKAHPEATFARFKELYSDDPQFKSFVLHGYTPLEAYELCHYHEKKPETEEAQRESTPSSVPSGTGTGTKPISQMSLDEYEKYAVETYGGY